MISLDISKLDPNTLLLATIAVSGAISGWYTRRERKKLVQRTEEVKKVLEHKTFADERRQAVVIKKLDVIKNAADDTKNKILTVQNTADDTHTLVNNSMAVVKKALAVACRKLANLTGDPEDSRLADEAEQAFTDHMARQEQVDQAVRDRSKNGG